MKIYIVTAIIGFLALLFVAGFIGYSLRDNEVREWERIAAGHASSAAYWQGEYQWLLSSDNMDFLILEDVPCAYDHWIDSHSGNEGRK